MGKGESVDKVGTNLSVHAYNFFFLTFSYFSVTGNGGVSPPRLTSWWPTTPGRCSAPSRSGSRGERRSIIRVTSCQVSRYIGCDVCDCECYWHMILLQGIRRRSSLSGITRVITGRSPTASAPPGSSSTWCGPRGWTVTTTPTQWGSGSPPAQTLISSSQAHNVVSVIYHVERF